MNRRSFGFLSLSIWLIVAGCSSDSGRTASEDEPAAEVETLAEDRALSSTIRDSSTTPKETSASESKPRKAANVPFKVVQPRESIDFPDELKPLSGLPLSPQLSDNGELLVFTAHTPDDFDGRKQFRTVLFDLNNRTMIRELPKFLSHGFSDGSAYRFRADGKQLFGAKDAYTAMLVSIPDGTVKEIALPNNEVNSRLMVVGYLRDEKTAFVMRGNGIQLIDSADGSLKEVISYPDGFPTASTTVTSTSGELTIVEESTAMLSGKLKEGETQSFYAWNFDANSPHVVGKIKPTSIYKTLSSALPTANKGIYQISLGNVTTLYEPTTEKMGKAFDPVYGLNGTSWRAGSLGVQQDGSVLGTAVVNVLASRGPAVVDLTFDLVTLKVFYQVPGAKIDEVDFAHCMNGNGTTIASIGQQKIYVFDATAPE